MDELRHVALGLLASLAAVWLVLVFFLLRVGLPSGSAAEAVRLLPDTVRLLRRLATDPAVPRGARVRLWLLFAYLAMPFDLIPDFIPVVGYADDAIVACFVLRSVARRAGTEVIRRHWPGTENGLAALWTAAGLSVTDAAVGMDPK